MCRGTQHYSPRPRTDELLDTNKLSRTRRTSPPPAHQHLKEQTKSRPKRKCLRKFNHPSRILIPLARTHTEGDTCQGGRNCTPPRESDHLRPSGRLVSRPKVKCLFGPRAKQRQEVCTRHITTDTTDADTDSPESSPGLHPEPPEVIRPCLETELPPLPPPRHFNVDRVTFTHPQETRRTLFDHYRASCALAPGPDSFSIAQRRLGISAEALENAITHEIDNLLLEIETTRRRELLEQLPFERHLSKEDCL